MRKTLLAMALVIALALGMMAPAMADERSGITSPSAGEVIYENTLALAGDDAAAEDNVVRWAVRDGTCEADADANRAGNVTGVDDDYAWADGEFSATIDIEEWEAGRYCFVLNTEQGEADGSRLTQAFFVVDEYAKVGGNVDHASYLIDNFGDGPPLQELRGAQLSHAFSGVVGNAGDAGTVGSVTVNYRQLDEHQTFEGAGLTLGAAGGIGVDDATARAAVMTAGDAQIILLDKDATANADDPDVDFPRGAAIVRADGSPSINRYEVDETPGSTGADSWLGLETGNVEVGIR